MKSRVGACLSFALCAVALIAATPAEAAFKKLGPISDPVTEEQDVAMDPAGRAFFVWERKDAAFVCPTDPCGVIEARVRTAGGTLGPVETISDPTRISSDPEVAVDARGNAIFTWAGEDSFASPQVLARTRTAAGVLGPIESIGVPGLIPFRPHVAVDEDFNAWFVWEHFDVIGPCSLFGCLRVNVRARSAAGVLGPLHTLTPAGVNGVFPQVGVDEDGRGALIAWRLQNGSSSCLGCSIIQARALSRAGVLSSTQNLSGTNFVGDPQLAVNESGAAVFTWEGFDGTKQCGGAPCMRIHARARSAKGSLSSTQLVSDSRQDAAAPKVGIDSGGKAVLVWFRGDGSEDCSGGAACHRVQARTRSSSGSLGKVLTLSESRRNGFVPQVAVDKRGNAVFVWERVDENFTCGPNTDSCSEVQARRLSYSGTLSKTQTLSELGAPSNPVVAVDPNGGRDRSRADAAADWVGPATQIEAAVQTGDDDD